MAACGAPDPSLTATIPIRRPCPSSAAPPANPAGSTGSTKSPFSRTLAVETAHFARVVLGREEPLSDGRFGAEVVRILDAAQRSLDRGGAPVEVTR